jgi:hypothetical protein
MKLILSISNEKSAFELGVSNDDVYEVNINMSFINLHNVKSCILLNVLILNHNHKINNINFI